MIQLDGLHRGWVLNPSEILFEMLKHLGPVIYAKSNLGHGLKNN